MLKMFVFGLFFNFFKLFFTALKNFKGFLRFFIFLWKRRFFKVFYYFWKGFYIYGLNDELALINKSKNFSQ